MAYISIGLHGAQPGRRALPDRSSCTIPTGCCFASARRTAEPHRHPHQGRAGGRAGMHAVRHLSPPPPADRHPRALYIECPLAIYSVEKVLLPHAVALRRHWRRSLSFSWWDESKPRKQSP
ncbi:hypothetical protein BHM03_00055727 [Ensete ventricosum]|nr:hypothetical protein BHM03_00055727 [Ensete ventricosum]